MGIISFSMFMPMMGHGCSTTDSHQRHEEKLQEVGNKACPILKKEINEKTKVTYAYKNKVYNLCCAKCIEKFNRDPEKYIK